jgi:hypothetical protein
MGPKVHNSIFAIVMFVFYVSRHFVSLWALKKCIVERKIDRDKQSQPLCVWFESGISVCSFFFLWYYSKGEML